MTEAAGRTKASAWLGALTAAVLLAIPLGAAWKIAPDLGHGWAAPLLMAYLWWERWAERPSLHPARVSWLVWLATGLAVAAALPLRLLLTPFPLWPVLVWAYALLLAGLAVFAAGLLAGRPGVRWLGGPLIVLAAALPWGTQLEQHVIYPLREGMATITAEASNFLGRPAIAAGTSLHLASGWVGVDEACGGIRSLEASVMIALFFGEWLRFSWSRRAALVGFGVLAALLGNFLRILYLSQRAGDGTAAFWAVHDMAGWLALAFSLALIGCAARRWARRRPAVPPATATAMPSVAGDAAGRGVATWIMVVASLLALEEAGVRGWYARGAAAHAAVPKWTVRMPGPETGFLPSALGEEARELLAPDLYVAGHWPLDARTTASAYYVEWQKGQVARFVPFLHNPTVCLPLAGCELEQTLGDVAVPWAGGELEFHAYIFRQAGEKLAVAFTVWDTSRGGPLEKASDSRNRLDWLRNRWTEVREARTDQPAQLLSLAVTGPDAQARLEPLLRQLVVQP